MNRRLLMMCSAAAGLGAYLLLSGDGPVAGLWQSLPWVQSRPADETPPAAAAAAAAEPAMKLNPLEGLKPQSFMATVERPLFNPGRQARPPEPPPPPPPPPVVEAPAPEPPPPGPDAADFKLLAIVADPSGRSAALRLVATGELVVVREGQPLQTWSVLSIADRSVVIGTLQDSVTLTLFEDAAAPSAMPAEDAPPAEQPAPPPSATD